VEVPYNVSDGELSAYAQEALAGWKGSMNPDEPITEIIVHEAGISRQMTTRHKLPSRVKA
jgi:hypothetical protein